MPIKLTGNRRVRGRGGPGSGVLRATRGGPAGPRRKKEGVFFVDRGSLIQYKALESSVHERRSVEAGRGALQVVGKGEGMRRLIAALALLGGALLVLPGCPGDARHNANHLQVLESNPRFLHENLDWVLMLDRPSSMHLSSEYWRLGPNP